MTDEHFVFDINAFTNKSVAGNLAAFTDGGVFLDFNERANFRVVANLAAVQIDELGKADAVSQFHIRSNADEVVQACTAMACTEAIVFTGTNSPRLWMERFAASSS